MQWVLPVTGVLELLDLPISSHGTRTEVNSSPKCYGHLCPSQTMAREKGTSPGNPQGLTTPLHVPFFLARFPCLCWPSKPRLGRGPFGHPIAGSQHLFTCIYLLSHVSDELGQWLLLGPLLGDSLLPPAELSRALVSQGPCLPISPHCFTFS